MIGQELVSAELLIPVCCGFEDSADAYSGYNTEEEEDMYDSGRDSEKSNPNSPKSKHAHHNSNVVAESHTPSYILNTSTKAQEFSIGIGYIYKYPSKSNTGDSIGTFTLLGAMVTINIARWAKRSDKFSLGDSTNMNRLTETFGMGEVERTLEANSEGQGYIHYEVQVRHHNDEWTVWRRYREFESYSKSLAKLGVKPSLGVCGSFEYDVLVI